MDNCPDAFNPDQHDSNGDGVDYACDRDCMIGSEPVDFEAFDALARSWRQAGPDLAGNLDRDGPVDLMNVAVFSGYWQGGCRLP